MSPIQCIVAITTGLFIPPMAAMAKPIESTGQQPVIVKLAPADGSASQPRVLTLNRMQAAEAPADAQPQARNIEAGGPWIGVQFGPVPKPLRSHLKLAEGVGQMVLNVAEGSPADVAGLLQYDVIIDIDGREASNDMGAFLDMIRSYRPNETHRFGLIRAGEPTSQQVVVGSRPADWNTLKYKYEMEEEPMAGGQLFQRGGMLEKDAQGNWQFKDLNQLKDMHDIWKHIPQFDPNDLQYSWRRTMPGDQNQVQIYVNQGREVRIEKNADGKITVTKTQREDGKESTTTATYDDEAAFEKADPDTFKSYQGGFGGGMGQFYGGPLFGQGFGGTQGKPFRFNYNLKELHEAADALRKEAEAAQKQADVLNEQLQNDMSQLRAVREVAKATTSFEVDADGSIRVTMRSAGGEIVERFQNVDQLKNSRPELYEKYQAIRGESKE